MRHHCIFALCLFIVIPISSAARADTAVSADPSAATQFILNSGRTGGWKFTVDATLQVKGLGIYDWNADGLEGSYPIGIWDESGTLLTSAIMPSGSVAELIDGVRYVESPDAILTVGQTYTIGYFASALFLSDRVLHDQSWHAINPLVHQVGPAVSSNGSFADMVMPTVGFTEAWVGPSFQFEVIPGPASWAALMLVVATSLGRRR